MSEQQFLEYAVPNASLAVVMERLRQEYPTILIGTKPLDAETTLLWLTLVAQESAGLAKFVAKLQADNLVLKHQPAPSASLSDLVARALQAQASEEPKG